MDVFRFAREEKDRDYYKFTFDFKVFAADDKRGERLETSTELRAYYNYIFTIMATNKISQNVYFNDISLVKLLS